ncbi:hypothetical protein PUN28_008548 [Cardiocondyla obscurior]|uniref:Uncharacterized protein n=1 Tax=Cardiocondyla obscurior TaxID=286306 RepID=A0AAW2G046_9HYME
MHQFENATLRGGEGENLGSGYTRRNKGSQAPDMRAALLIYTLGLRFKKKLGLNLSYETMIFDLSRGTRCITRARGTPHTCLRYIPAAYITPGNYDRCRYCPTLFLIPLPPLHHPLPCPVLRIFYSVHNSFSLARSDISYLRLLHFIFLILPQSLPSARPPPRHSHSHIFFYYTPFSSRSNFFCPIRSSFALH